MIDSIRFRLFWIKYGVFFFKSSGLSLKRLRIGPDVVEVCCPPGEEEANHYETLSIFYEDCYRLRKMSGIHTIVDIGANVGLFSMAARSLYPDAKIHAYEPNPSVQSYLCSNLKDLSVEVFAEAVGSHSGSVAIEAGPDSLHARTVRSDTGEVSQIAILDACRRVGDRINLLKLDCEGAEWEIFKEESFWGLVDNLVLEYHLWAAEDESLLSLVDLIKRKGFRIAFLSENKGQTWGMLHAIRND